MGHVFERLRARWPGYIAGDRLPSVWRPGPRPACCYGLALAPQSAFDEQRDLFARMSSWDAQCVQLLRRLESGRAPLVLDLFCGAGGASEGARRVSASVCGVDRDPQPAFSARFGDEWFALGDALDAELLRGLVRRLRPFVIWASPPCQGYSSQTFGGDESTEPRLIAAVRDVLVGTGVPFIIENVRGAASEMPAAVTVWGQFFGLRTARPRLLEGGNGLELSIPNSLLAGGEPLRRASCLGRHARYPRLDGFDRPMAHAC